MSSSNVTYTLRYFPAIGLAESTRLLLTAAKVEWTEEHPEWPQAKPEQPHGRLPVLIEKSSDGSPDFVVCESGNIERYIARKYNLMPADLQQAARQEQLRDLGADVGVSLAVFAYSEVEETKVKAYEKFETLMKTVIEVQTKQLKENGNNGHLFGDSLSYADITAYGMYKNLIIGFARFKSDIADCIRPMLTPELLKLISTVEAHPLVEKHTAKADSLVSVVSA
ncbi:hypothetical protein EV183_002495 [Coemansia sp. RSA 2336]|nr:hypothetical protein EV183_002495 [Coemansia sp. RSA 2336]